MIVLEVLLIIPTFLICLFIDWKFSWSKEAKDERGQKILNLSFQYSIPKRNN